MTDLIGYIAAALGTLVMLPQVVKTIRSKSAHDVSAVMLGTYLVQCVLWGIYGSLIHAIPLVACNVTAFCLCAWQAALKYRYERMPVR